MISTKYIFSRASPFSYNKGSFIWRGLKELGNAFTSSCKWVVGSGLDILFWSDKWVGDSMVRDCVSGPLNHHELDLKVSNFLENGKWTLNELSFNLPPNLLKMNLCTAVPYSNLLDKPISKYANNDKFVFKKSYNDQFFFDSALTKDFLKIWNASTLPKLKVFMWQCFSATLPTKNTLSSKGMPITPSCPFCPQTT